MSINSASFLGQLQLIDFSLYYNSGLSELKHLCLHVPWFALVIIASWRFVCFQFTALTLPQKSFLLPTPNIAPHQLGVALSLFAPSWELCV